MDCKIYAGSEEVLFCRFRHSHSEKCFTSFWISILWKWLAVKIALYDEMHHLQAYWIILFNFFFRPKAHEIHNEQSYHDCFLSYIICIIKPSGKNPPFSRRITPTLSTWHCSIITPKSPCQQLYHLNSHEFCHQYCSSTTPKNFFAIVQLYHPNPPEFRPAFSSSHRPNNKLPKSSI